ncbi:hypothetical protein D3C87_1261710 [compost metagenome]
MIQFMKDLKYWMRNFEVQKFLSSQPIISIDYGLFPMECYICITSWTRKQNKSPIQIYTLPQYVAHARENYILALRKALSMKLMNRKSLIYF